MFHLRSVWIRLSQDSHPMALHHLREEHEWLYSISSHKLSQLSRVIRGSWAVSRRGFALSLQTFFFSGNFVLIVDEKVFRWAKLSIAGKGRYWYITNHTCPSFCSLMIRILPCHWWKSRRWRTCMVDDFWVELGTLYKIRLAQRLHSWAYNLSIRPVNWKVW